MKFEIEKSISYTAALRNADDLYLDCTDEEGNRHSLLCISKDGKLMVNSEALLAVNILNISDWDGNTLLKI